LDILHWGLAVLPGLILRRCALARQLGDVRRDPPCFVLGEQLRRRAPARLTLKIDINKLLAVSGPNDKSVGPRLRQSKAAGNGGRTVRRTSLCLIAAA